MKLRRIVVTGFRKHVQPVEIVFDERLTFVTGPNEAGKSTIFEALRYALFRRSGAGARDIEALTPWSGADGPPSVVLDFTTDDGVPYRLTKSWGQKGTATLERTDTDPPVRVEVPDVDTHVAALFSGSPPGKGAFSGFKAGHLGLAYLLFAPQGQMVVGAELEADGSIGPQAVGRLGELVGAKAISSDDERVIRNIEARYAEFYTAVRGLKKAAPSVILESQVLAVDQELVVMRSERDRFERIAEELQGLEDHCDELELLLEKAKAERDLRLPHVREAIIRKADLDSAVERQKRAVDEHDQLHARMWEVETEERQLAELSAKRAELAATHAQLEDSERRAQDELVSASGAFDAAFKEDEELASTEARLERARDARGARERLDVLLELQREVAGLQGDFATLGAEIAAVPAITDDEASALRELKEEEAALRAQIQAASLTLDLAAKRVIDLTISGERIRLRGGDRLERASDGAFTVSLDGIADIVVRGPLSNVGDKRVRLGAVVEEIERLGTRLGTTDPIELERLRVEYESLIQQRNHVERELQRKLGGIGGPEDLAAQIALLDDKAGAALPEAELEALRAAVVERKQALHTRRDAARAAVAEAQLALNGARDDLTNSQAFVEDIDRKIGMSKTAIAVAIGNAKTKEELLRRGAAAATARVSEDNQLASAEQRYGPYRDLADPTAELTRLGSAVDELARVLQGEVGNREVRRAEYEELQAAGISARIATLEEHRADLDAQRARAECDELAAKLLRDRAQNFTASRNRELAEPLLATVGPWFERISSHSLSGLTLTESGAASQLQLREVPTAVKWADLSVGTGDQLGVLLRLALGMELAAKTPLPILLDDPLAHCDPRRTLRLLDVVAEAAAHTQVIVFTYDESMCASFGKIVPLR